MEAEMSHKLPLSWRTRKASGLITRLENLSKKVDDQMYKGILLAMGIVDDLDKVKEIKVSQK